MSSVKRSTVRRVNDDVCRSSETDNKTAVRQIAEPMSSLEKGRHVKSLSDIVQSPQRDEIDPIFKCQNKFEILTEEDLSKETCLCTNVISRFRNNEKFRLIKESGDFVTIRK